MKTQKDAIQKAMDYLAMRDHSRHELRTKLAKYDFIEEDIEAALNHVEASGWLLPPQVLADKVAGYLHRKNKSHMYINRFLHSKKLPSVPRDSDLEREKARSLLQGGRFSRLKKSSSDDRKQAAQFLKFRGFDSETIMRVLNEAPGDSKEV